MSKVFVLGAGFSKAISASMPLLSELPALLGPTLSTDANRPMDWQTRYDNNVERWLSQLAEPPPWRTVAEAAHDRAAALEISENIGSIVSGCQEKVHASPCPDWLMDLVTKWNNGHTPDTIPPAGHSRTAVITLNYDTLVERAYMELSAPGSPNGGATSSGTDVLVASLAPFTAIGSVVIAGRGAAWFQLLKLHGSVDWYRQNTESTNSPMFCDYTPRRWQPTDDPPDLVTDTGDPRWRFLIADKSRFIVPPTAVKTRFYNDAVLRAQWREAATAIRSASELILMGFSLPATDTLVRDLLLELPPAANITVVDNSLGRADEISETLGRPATQFLFTSQPISEWATAWR